MSFVGNISIARPLPKPWSDVEISFFDVGARGGPPASWLKFQQKIHYLCFEPDPEEAFLLRQTLAKNKLIRSIVVEAALGSVNGSARLFLTKYRPSSSLLQPNLDFLSQLQVCDGFSVKDKITVRMSTLDSITLAELKSCDFLKIDAQGSELAILQGGASALKSAIGCELEVAFGEIYKGQPLFSDIDHWMRGQGFFLADLERFWWRRKKMPLELQERGTLAYGNATYLKCATLSPKNLEEANRAVVICLAIGLDELAYEIVGKSRECGWISASEQKLFETWIQHHRRASAFWFRLGFFLRFFPARRTLARWFGLWSRALQGSTITGSDADSWNRKTSW